MTEAGMGRVLILVENLSVPSDRRVWQESLSLSRAGYEVVVVCPQGPERDSAPFELRQGVEIHRFPLRPASGRQVDYVREYAVALWRIFRLVRRLGARRRFDVVHACNPPDLLLLAAWPARRRGARFVFDLHDPVPELHLSRFGPRRGAVFAALLAAERLAFRQADVVLCVNESCRALVRRRGGLPDDAVFVVRNAPDPARFRPIASDPLLKRRRAHLLAYLGVIGPQDGVEHALRALAHLRSVRDDWHAIFMGDGDSLATARALSIELGLADCTEFTGHADDRTIVRILSTADVCLEPAPSSPLNDLATTAKVAEYMAMAKPIVAFDLPETRETAGESALYARPNDERDWACCVAALLDDPERRAVMGRLGRARVEETLSWEQSGHSLLAAYDRALRRPELRRR
jgi:glycosyltransferase involved in cell wall biosynthesis